MERKGFLHKLSDAVKSAGSRSRLEAAPTDCPITGGKGEAKPVLGEGLFLFGTSICGDDTALLTEGGKIGLDAGPSAARLPTPDILFISHHHFDHLSGLPAVACKASREGKVIDLYIGKNLPEYALKWIEKVADSDGALSVHGVWGGDSVDIDKDTKLEFFDTNHSEGSLGVSIVKRNERGDLENYLTYTGDINIGDPEMRKEPHLHSARHLVVEASYFGNPVARPFYDVFAHSSFEDIKELLRERQEAPESVTAVHLPHSLYLMHPCPLIEEAMDNMEGKDIGYIPTCWSGPRDPLYPRERVSLEKESLRQGL